MKINDISNMNGMLVKAKSFAPLGFSQRSPESVCNNAGMSGSEGILQSHDNDNEAMWLTINKPGGNNWIGFDLGCVEQLGYMFVWNFNQTKYTGSGIREAIIEYSIDGINYTELKEQGWPYRFAQADGSSSIKATNLDLEGNPPIDFAGISVRYVRITPNENMFVGNWGGYVENQHRYGLSQVRFYKYKPKASKYSYLSSKASTFDIGRGIDFVTSSCGLSDVSSKLAQHDNDPKKMWLSDIMPKQGEILFDLDGTYPLDEMHVWNYNEKGQTDAGIKNVEIFYSIDGSEWLELRGEGYPYCLSKANGTENITATNLNIDGNPPIKFYNARARFVKLRLNGGPHNGTWGCYRLYEHRYGIAKVRFYAGDGYCAEPARDFTGMLSNYNGWSGADGIFAAPVNGKEYKRTGTDVKDAETIFIFSDTFVGKVNPITRFRNTYSMVNNTAGKMKGINPATADFNFICNTSEAGYVNMLEVPKDKRYIYWLQDCVIINNSLYSFTDNVVEDLSQPEGFQFKLVGVDMIKINITNANLEIYSQKSKQTPFFTNDKYFGCCILPNSFEAELPFADGYIYIYGLMSRLPGQKSLVLARVEPECFEDFSSYTFYDGEAFSKDISDCAEICDDGASEMSITPIESGEYKGKYLYTYSPQSVNNTICCRIAETPWGPFSERISLYHITESVELGKTGASKVYCYNSKAHYHLSGENELLISSNINAMDFESHIFNADIYRPRFIRLRLL